MDTAPTGAPRADAARGAMKRVLLVDGNVHVLQVMKSSLDRHGYEVDTALGPDVAAALYRDAAHDVVILDADAHGRRGEALAASLLDGAGELRRAAGGAAPLVVSIGGAAARASGDASRPGSGPERWAKPVSLRWLVARLAEHFGRYGPPVAAPPAVLEGVERGPGGPGAGLSAAGATRG